MQFTNKRLPGVLNFGEQFSNRMQRFQVTLIYVSGLCLRVCIFQTCINYAFSSLSWQPYQRTLNPKLIRC
jgi:hypothetical protein